MAHPPYGIRTTVALAYADAVEKERDDGKCVVAAVDPDSMLGVVGDNPVVAEVARDARSRLQRALETIA